MAASAAAKIIMAISGMAARGKGRKRKANKHVSALSNSARRRVWRAGAISGKIKNGISV